MTDAYSEITGAQRDILKDVYKTDDVSTISQMWYVDRVEEELGLMTKGNVQGSAGLLCRWRESSPI